MRPLPPLVDRLVPGPELPAAEARAAAWPALPLDDRALADLARLGHGAYSPLVGFLDEADHRAVCAGLRLADGRPWPVPVELPAEEAAARAAEAAGHARLVGADGVAHGEIEVREVFAVDPAASALAAFGTADPAHPGVAAWLARPAWRVAGPVRYYGRAPRAFPAQHRGPAELRAQAAGHGWARVAGAAIAPPLTRADEHRHKLALALADGLLLHPVEADGPLPAAGRMRSATRLVAAYYPAGRVLVGGVALPTGHAPARDAVLHALVLANAGCSHVLLPPGLGDDEAAVAALAEEAGLVVVRPGAAFHCRACDGPATAGTCPHPEGSRVATDAAQLQALLAAGQAPPPEVMRPEVAAVFLAGRPGTAELADGAAVPPRARTIWLTGRPGAGTSTLARGVAAALRTMGRRADVLDAPDAGEDDPLAAARRLGALAGVLNRNGVDAVVAAVAPLAAGHAAARGQAPDAVEVYVACPVEVCAARDPRGLYARAFAGEAVGLPGVDAAYAPPAAPDLEVRTDLEDEATCVDRIVALVGA